MLRLFVGWVSARDCESIMILASPFVKGGSRGILLSHRLLIFNNNFLIDQISPNPSLLKRGIKRILSQRNPSNSSAYAGNTLLAYARKALFRPTASNLRQNRR